MATKKNLQKLTWWKNGNLIYLSANERIPADNEMQILLLMIG